MTIPYQELIHLDPDTKYQLAIKDSRKLLEANLRKSERPDFQERRKKIRSLLEQIPIITRTDVNEYKQLKELTMLLLQTDPLTDQQAGSIARWEWYLNHPWDIQSTHYEEDELSLDEVIELRVGEWSSIQAITTSSNKRKLAWEASLREANEADEIWTVYRGAQLSEKDVERILQQGVIPAGFWNYGNLDMVLEKWLWSLVRKETPSDLNRYTDEKRNWSNAYFLPYAKSPVFTNHWALDPDGWFGFDTPESLAISTTPDRLTATRFGTHIMEIELPASRLIKRWYERGMNDCSVLYYIEPSSIKGIYPS